MYARGSRGKRGFRPVRAVSGRGWGVSPVDQYFSKEILQRGPYPCLSETRTFWHYSLFKKSKEGEREGMSHLFYSLSLDS